jgi:hypothetical protein
MNGKYGTVYCQRGKYFIKESFGKLRWKIVVPVTTRVLAGVGHC